MFITIALSTWNRATILDQTLFQMRLLRIPAGVQWELVVVNNNCTDDTDAVIARHSGDLPLRRLFEPNQGSSYGRNRAITASAGEVICFTDDDVLVDPEWLAEYVQAAKAWPQAGFFGGRIEPWFVKEPPPSIRRYIHVIGKRLRPERNGGRRASPREPRKPLRGEHGFPNRGSPPTSF